jgi:hypothetical protein
VVELQARHRKPGQRIQNDLQTNGTLLDEEWASFLKQQRFLVGLSCDGPATTTCTPSTGWATCARPTGATWRTRRRSSRPWGERAPDAAPPAPAALQGRQRGTRRAGWRRSDGATPC